MEAKLLGLPKPALVEQWVCQDILKWTSSILSFCACWVLLLIFCSQLYPFRFPPRLPTAKDEGQDTVLSAWAPQMATNFIHIALRVKKIRFGNKSCWGSDQQQTQLFLFPSVQHHPVAPAEAGLPHPSVSQGRVTSSSVLHRDLSRYTASSVLYNELVWAKKEVKETLRFLLFFPASNAWVGVILLETIQPLKEAVAWPQKGSKSQVWVDHSCLLQHLWMCPFSVWKQLVQKVAVGVCNLQHFLQQREGKA